MRACGIENEFRGGAARRPRRLAYEMVETREQKGKSNKSRNKAIVKVEIAGYMDGDVLRR